jgi:hypothetical protein
MQRKKRLVWCNHTGKSRLECPLKNCYATEWVTRIPEADLHDAVSSYVLVCLSTEAVLHKWCM